MLQPSQILRRVSRIARQGGAFPKALAAFVLVLVSSSAFAQTANMDKAMDLLRKKQYVAAVKLFQKAAREGNHDAFFMLGVLHQTGYGVKKSNRDAVLLYRHIALRGHGRAQVKLASFYASGAGVKQNRLLAYMWFEVAAQNGESLDIKPRVGLAIKMKQSEIDLARKKARLCLKSKYKTCE